MDIVLVPSSDKPMYVQIYEQVSAQIVRGDLKSGSMLPPIRSVALELRVSVITVKKAWEELERGGFIVTMVGRGCFVAPVDKGSARDKRGELIAERLKAELAYYRSLGLSAEELIELVREYY